MLTSSCATPQVSEYAVEAACERGKAHGPYTATGPGGDRIEGQFCRGVRCGVFTFSSGPGLKVAEFPYTGRQLHGLVRLWYLPHTAPDSPHRKKFEGAYAEGRRHGESRSWWPTGTVRSSFVYRHGVLSGGTAWTPEGDEAPAAEAAALERHDADADRRLFRALGSIITANPPSCGD